MKKLILKIGSLSMAAGAILATTLTVASCGSSTEEVPGGDTPYKDVSKFVEYPQIKELQSKLAPEGSYGTYKTINQEAADSLNKIIDAMSNDTDVRWHPIGEPMLDAVNAIRYAIYKNSSNDSSVKENLSKFIQIVRPDLYNFPKTPGGNGATEFQVSATKDVNEWLNGQTNDLFIADIAKAERGGANNTNTNYKLYALADNDATKEKPLRLSIKMLEQSQFRTQQVEWRAAFDNHDTNQTQHEITKHTKVNSNTGVYSDAPTKSDGLGWQSNENYLIQYKNSDNDIDAAKVKTNGETNIYLAMADAVETLYDNLDGSGTTGHRTNFYASNLDRFGYSRINDIEQKWNYFFTETSDARDSTTAITNKSIEDYKSNYVWVSRLKGQQILDYASSNGMDIHDLILKMINVGPDNKFNGWLSNQEWFRNMNFMNKQYTTINSLISDVDAEIVKHNFNIETEKNDDFMKSMNDAGYQTVSEFQINKQSEDTVLPYNINNGGTQTGKRFGYSQLPKKWFE
ncbi:MAG: hypothetical protein NC236_01805 [Mycoplasma sp.]|nr:hypothetical protein [Mycoplasma sp.]